MMKLKYRRLVVMMGNQNTSQSSQNFFLIHPRVFGNMLKIVIHQRGFLCLFKGDKSRPAALNKISLIYDHNKAVFTHTKSTELGRETSSISLYTPSLCCISNKLLAEVPIGNLTWNFVNLIEYRGGDYNLNKR